MKNLLKQLRIRPLITLFLMVCLIITSLSVSIISSMIDKEKFKMQEGNLGYKFDNLIEYVLFSNKGKSLKDLENNSYYKKYPTSLETEIIIEKGYVPVSIINVNFNYIDKMSVYKVADKSDMNNSVAVGNKCYEKLGRPKEISIFNRKYKISHILGIKNEKTSFEDCIVINNKILSEEDKANFKLFSDNMLKFYGGNNFKNEGTKIENSFNNNTDFQVQNSVDGNRNELKTAYKAQSDSIYAQNMLIAIGLCNVIIVSTFWIIDRRKEIAVRKAFGSSKREIELLVFKELFFLSLISSLIAIVVQIILTYVGNKYFQFTLKPSVLNLGVLCVCSFVVTIIASIIPVSSALHMNISQCLKE